MATLAELAYQRRAEQAALEQQQAELLRQQQEQARAQEQALAQQNNRTWGEALFQDLPLQLLGSAVGLGQAAYGAANMATFGLLDYANPLDMPANFQETQKILLRAQTPRTQAAVQRVSEAYDRGIGAGLAESADLAYLQNLAAGNAASLLPGAAAARAGSVKAAADALAKGLSTAEVRAAAQAGGTKALERTVGAQIAGATNVDTINAIREQGGSEEQQLLGGLGAGALAGLGGVGLMRLTGAGRLEAAAANALPGGVGAGQLNRGVVTETLAGLAREGTEESLQSATERLSQNLFTPNVSLGKGVGEAFGTGLVAGGLLGGGMGATVSLSTPRTNDATPLGKLIRDKFAQLNGRSGAPVAPSAVSDAPAPETPPTMEVEELSLEDISPLPVADVPLDSGPAGGIESIDLAGTPLPSRSLPEITGRVPQVTPPRPPLAEVEELPASAFQRPGLLGVLDAQRGRGNVEAGFDLLGGALPAEGAFPQVAGAEAATPAATAPKTQTKLDFETAPTLKKTMTQLLGVKPAALRGKAWNDFETAAAAAGVTPTSPELEPFLRQYTQTLTDSDTAFAGRMAEKYGTPAEAAAPTPAPAQPTPAEVQGAAKTTLETKLAGRVSAAEIAALPAEEANRMAGVLDRADGALGQDTSELAQSARALVEAAIAAQVGANTLRGRNADMAKRNAASAAVTAARKAFKQKGAAALTDAELQQALVYYDGESPSRRALVKEVERRAAPTPAQIEHAEEVVEAAASVGQPTEGVTPGTTEPAAEPPQDQALLRDLNRTIKQAMNDDPTETHESAATFAINELLMEAPGIEELNQYFMAAKALPIYKDLPADMRKEIDDTFDRIHTYMDAGYEGPYDPMKASKRARFDRREGGALNKPRPGRTETPAFKRWFGDSKVVDADGKPLRVYHGTKADFDAFDIDTTLWNALRRLAAAVVPGASSERAGERRAAFFTSSASGASTYATSDRTWGDAPNVVPVYLRIERPLVVDGAQRTATTPSGEVVSLGEGASPNVLIDLAREHGADGVVIKDIEDAATGETGADMYLAFADTQIKSAIGNIGTYDPTNPDIRYSQADPEAAPRTHMPIDQFEQLIDRANQMLGQSHPSQRTVVGVETVADFEMMTGQAAPSDARGAFVNGKTYLILENIADKKDFGFVLAHERGHQGLAALLGDRLPAVVNRLWTNPATRKRIQAKMRTMDARSTEENGSLRRLAGEEVLADMLAGGEKLNGDVLSKLRSALDNAFTAFIGAGKLQMSNAEVDALLRDVAAVTRGASPAAIREGDPKHLQGLQFAMADPAELTTGDPRFSRAEADMEEIVASALNEQTAKRTIGDVGIEAASAAWDKMRNLQGATVGHRILDVALNATPLNQMANAFDKLFDGKLKAFARLKRRKEAESNKALTAERELVYRGADKDQQVKTSPVGLAKQWAKFKSRFPAQAAALDWLNRESTLYRLWPEKSWDQQSKLDYNEMGFAETERRAAYNEVRRLWKAAGPQGQDIFRASQAIYDRMWGERFEALSAEISRATGIPRKLADGKNNPAFWDAHGRRIDSALHKLRTGPYSPLQRYGDFLVTVRDQQGRVVWFSGHDSIEEANRVSAQMKAGDFAGDQYRVTSATLRRDQNGNAGRFSQAEIHALENIAETVDLRGMEGEVNQALDSLANVGDPAATKHLREEIRRALVETYLQSLPQSAFLSHANRRKNTKGATLDSFRAFNDYTVKAAHSIASLKHDGEISSLLTGLQQVATEAAADPNAENVLRRQQVVEAAKAQHTASLEVEQNKVANALSQAGFFMFMSSPSQLFINSMQTFMVTLPRMVAAYGNSAGIKAVRSALTKFALSRGNLLGENTVLDKNGPVYQILQELHERGTLDFTLAMDMMGYARGDSSALSGHWRSMLEVAGWAMQKSEVFNRQVAAVAAAELEVQKRNLTGPLSPDQLKELADIADDMVLTTQFDFSQSNKPPIMQGPWRKVILQFQTYRLNMLAMMAKDIRDSFSGTKDEKESARRALAWMLGTQLALTGVAGTVLAPLVFGIADAFRDDDDLLDSETEFVRAVPQILAHGLLAGVVDTRRVGANQLVQPGGAGYAPTDASAKETFQYYALANLGPWAGLGANIFDGIEKALGGDHVGAMKGLAPAGIRDVYRAYFEAADGAKDSRRIVHYEPGVWDTAMTVVGLRSGDRREHEEKRGASYEASSKAYTLKDRYLARLALGYSLGDQDMIDEASTKMDEFNAKYPDLAITGRDRAQAVIRRIRTEHNAAATGIATSRPLADSIRQQIGM